MRNRTLETAFTLLDENVSFPVEFFIIEILAISFIINLLYVHIIFHHLLHAFVFKLLCTKAFLASAKLIKRILIMKVALMELQNASDGNEAIKKYIHRTVLYVLSQHYPTEDIFEYFGASQKELYHS